MRTIVLASGLLIAATRFVGAVEPSSPEATAPQRMNDYFRHARDAFSKQQLDEASRDIHAGADIVRQEASKATGEEKDRLVASAGDLKQLASRVEKGSVKDVRELNREFARADNRLAAHYQKLASESWGQQNASKTGRALHTATAYFKEAATWSGEKATDAAETARTVSGKLVEGAGWVPKEVGEAISGLGHGIQELGEKLEPGKATAGTRERPPGSSD